MNRAPAIQRRLGIGLAAGVLVMWLAATLVSGSVVRDELDEAFDDALRETAQRLLPLAAEDVLNRQGPMRARRLEAVDEEEEHLTYVVRDARGAVLLESRDADPGLFPAVPVVGFHDTPTHRIYGEAAIRGTLYVEVAEPLEDRAEAATEATLALLIPLPILVPLSVLGAWWLVRRSLRPVHALRAQIETRGGGDLTPLRVERLPAEIGPIADSVNRLMDRLRGVLEAERAFTANSAHELRTPIAGALAQAQRLIAETPEGETREHARRVEESLHRLARLSEKLLQLARAEAGRYAADANHDLGPVLALVVDEFGRTGAPVALADAGLESLRAPMDADAFAIAVRNLVENALKHGAPGETVGVRVDEGAVRVVNAGAVVPPDTLAGLTERFARGATAASGSGLGLAIVEAIALGAGGRLELRSPAPGRADGFEAALVLPPPLAERPGS